MDLITLTCPSCGAPVTLAENVLAVVCAYCRSPIQRRDDPAARLDAARENGRRALRLGDYDEANLLFAEVLGQDAADRRSRLYRALALAMLVDPDERQALAFLRAAGGSPDEAAADLAGLAAESPQLLRDLLAHHAGWLATAPPLAELAFAAALACQPAEPARLATAYTAAAEQAWQKGSIDIATALMVKALALDPDARPVNLWLYDLAQKKLVRG